MSASLVGSEMCIRDSQGTACIAVMASDCVCCAKEQCTHAGLVASFAVPSPADGSVALEPLAGVQQRY
eukprot:8884932-Alexandrium_andersonii.AAC.1